LSDHEKAFIKSKAIQKSVKISTNHLDS